MAAITVGEGEWTYEVVENWAKPPPGWSFKEIGSIGVDRKDNVYVFNRGEHPMIVFDRDGNFLKSWGEGRFPRAHGVHMGPDDTIWLTDDADHTVRQCTLDGKVLLELGVPGRPTPYMSGLPFHRCTHTALSPRGEIYVADGYGNSSVHKFSPDGKLIKSWGGPGTDPGEFNIVHNITCDGDGYVYVADRENHRVQVFDGEGRYQAQWNNLHRPCALYMPPGKCPVCFIGELGPGLAVNRNMPNIGPRIAVVDHTGKRLARIGSAGGPGLGPTEFQAPHGIAVDSRGDLYVGEVSWTNWPTFFPDRPRPENLRSLHKFRKIAAVGTASAKQAEAVPAGN
jgi:DNA-binding beta-propeller fold protein YncE